MTPKEKARELRDKMYLKIPAVYDPTNLPHFPIAKEMSLIAVDEIIKAVESDWSFMEARQEYWQEVRSEIELL
jgi:hypothetical protein